MARSIEITDSEILSELRNAGRVMQPDPPGVFVVSELAAKTNTCERTIRAQLATLRREGRVEMVHVHREGSDGRIIRKTAAYRILPAPKAKR